MPWSGVRTTSPSTVQFGLDPCTMVPGGKLMEDDLIDRGHQADTEQERRGQAASGVGEVGAHDGLRVVTGWPASELGALDSSLV